MLTRRTRWWSGRSSPFGVCYDRREVIDVLRPHIESPSRARLTDLQAIGDGLVVQADLLLGDEPTNWIAVLRLDAAGRITRIQDYESGLWPSAI